MAGSTEQYILQGEEHGRDTHVAVAVELPDTLTDDRLQEQLRVYVDKMEAALRRAGFDPSAASWLVDYRDDDHFLGIVARVPVVASC